MCPVLVRRPSTALAAWLALTSVACSMAVPEPVDLCAQMAARCGAGTDDWERWCRSECVPEAARTTPCDVNDACLLCDTESAAGVVDLFGLPSDQLEFLWTQRTSEPESPPSAAAPTGSAFDDGLGAWDASPDGRSFGAWRALVPVEAALGDPGAYFCEPGPSLFVADGVQTDAGGEGVLMRAERIPSTRTDLACPAPYCPAGPYDACGTPTPSVCPYGDAPETHGFGTASQLDRVGAGGAIATYGHGRYRATLRASGDTSGPVSGTVYAFFSQSNEPCVGTVPQPETNTAEIDVELTSGTTGVFAPADFCGPDEECMTVSTWSSSRQGLPSGVGAERHASAAFRFRARAIAGALHTYGYDWSADRVRFVYDADPDDCDEGAGACAPAQASIAICELTHFVPQRAAPLHLQTWNAWWAGTSPPDTRSEMTVRRVWHVPQP